MWCKSNISMLPAYRCIDPKWSISNWRQPVCSGKLCPGAGTSAAAIPHSPWGSYTGWAGSYPRASLGTTTQPRLPSAWCHHSRNWLWLELSLLSSQFSSHQIAFIRLTALPVATPPGTCLWPLSLPGRRQPRHWIQPKCPLPSSASALTLPHKFLWRAWQQDIRDLWPMRTVKFKLAFQI